MDGNLRQRVDRARKHRPVAFERFDQSAVQQLDAQAAAARARKEPALDRPLDAAFCDAGTAEADELQRSKS